MSSTFSFPQPEQPPPLAQRCRIPIERVISPATLSADELGAVIHPCHLPLLLDLGQMADLARHLQAIALVSMPDTRPWDDDPGRVPFGSTGRRRSAGSRAPGAAAHGAPPTAGAR